MTNHYSHWNHPLYWNGFEDGISSNREYLFDIAKSMGVSSDDIQLLLNYGCGADEIEELLYNPCLLHDIVSEIRYDWYGEEVNPWDWVKS